MRYLCFLALPCSTLLLGCGLGISDSKQVKCRCTENTDLTLFPECRDATAMAGERPNASDPFSTRVPDCPSGNLLALLEPTRPEFVLFNVKSTIENFSPLQYLDQITENFLFVPDDEDILEFPEIFTVPPGYDPEADQDSLWTFEQERFFIINLLDRQRFQKIEFLRWFQSSKDERIIEDDLTESFVFNYELRLTEKLLEDEEFPKILEVKGRAELRIVSPTKENPEWDIERWRDFRDPASAKRSLTELKALFAR